jgi:hypothetical protein
MVNKSPNKSVIRTIRNIFNITLSDAEATQLVKASAKVVSAKTVDIKTAVTSNVMNEKTTSQTPIDERYTKKTKDVVHTINCDEWNLSLLPNSLIDVISKLPMKEPVFKHLHAEKEFFLYNNKVYGYPRKLYHLKNLFIGLGKNYNVSTLVKKPEKPVTLNVDKEKIKQLLSSGDETLIDMIKELYPTADQLQSALDKLPKASNIKVKSKKQPEVVR